MPRTAQAPSCLWPVFLSRGPPRLRPASGLWSSGLRSTTSASRVSCLFSCGSKLGWERSWAWAATLMFLACIWNSFISGAKHKGQFQQPLPSTHQLWYRVWTQRAQLKIDPTVTYYVNILCRSWTWRLWSRVFLCVHSKIGKCSSGNGWTNMIY